MSRKTVDIEFVKAKANTFLAESTVEMVEMRRGVSALLEAVLFETDNYKGYTYLASEFIEGEGKLKPHYDETRRVYF